MVMNDDAIEDLKQFIGVTVSQQTFDISSDIKRLDNRISELDANLSKKIEDLSDSVAEAIQSSNDSVDAQLKDHDQRILKLEQKVT